MKRYKIASVIGQFLRFSQWVCCRRFDWMNQNHSNNRSTSNDDSLRQIVIRKDSLELLIRNSWVKMTRQFNWLYEMAVQSLNCLFVQNVQIKRILGSVTLWHGESLVLRKERMQRLSSGGIVWKSCTGKIQEIPSK